MCLKGETVILGLPVHRRTHEKIGNLTLHPNEIDRTLLKCMAFENRWTELRSLAKAGEGGRVLISPGRAPESKEILGAKESYAQKAHE